MSVKSRVEFDVGGRPYTVTYTEPTAWQIVNSLCGEQLGARLLAELAAKGWTLQRTDPPEDRP